MEEGKERKKKCDQDGEKGEMKERKERKIKNGVVGENTRIRGIKSSIQC